MPRKPRMYLAGIPAHVVQRGNNRDACFFCDEDYQFYLEVLGQGLRRYHVDLHAYCLMTNHVHFLMTPDDESGISRVMQHIGRLYVSYINRTYHRSGTLWEGRHKSSLINADEYLLKCYRYIEMNPVADGLVTTPEQYQWSSYGWHAFGKVNPLISDHTLYDALGRTADDRHDTYRELFKTQILDADIHAIKNNLSYNYPLGNKRFKDQIEMALGRAVGQRQRGRPRELVERG